MARDGAECAPKRSAAQRAAGRQWAKWSADNAVRRLTGELGRTRARLEAAEQALGAVIGDDEVAHRLQAMLPALQATLGGWTPSWLERLRRNVALHAEAQGMDIVAASAAELRSAQRGPRLERRAAADGALRADAPPFVPLGPIGAGAPGGGVPHTPHNANQLLADLIASEGCQHAQTDGIDTELEAVGVQDDLDQLMADLAAELGGEADFMYAAAAEPGPGTGGFSPPKSQSQGRGEFGKLHDAEEGARARGGFAQEAAQSGGTAGTSEPMGLAEAAGSEAPGDAEHDALYGDAGGAALRLSGGTQARGAAALEPAPRGDAADIAEPEGTCSSVVAAEAVAELDACADLSAEDQLERHSEPSPTAPEVASGQWRSASDELRDATSALLMDLEAQLAAAWARG